MIYEMRTYSFLPTDLPKYLKHAEEVGRLVRGNYYGVNCGYWTSEFGRLNQVWHLWRYEVTRSARNSARSYPRIRIGPTNTSRSSRNGSNVRISKSSIRIRSSHRRKLMGIFTNIAITGLRSVELLIGSISSRKRYHIARSIQNLSDFGILRRDN